MTEELDPNLPIESLFKRIEDCVDFAAAGQTEVWRPLRRGEGALGFGLVLCFVRLGLELPPMGQGAVQHVLRVMVALWLCVPCRLRGPTMHMF